MLLATSIAVYSYSEKGRRKSACDNPERDCGWFWVRCSSQKFERMAREAMDVCLRVLREATKEFLTVTVPGTVYWSYLILPFGIVACTFLPTTSLEIAVNVWLGSLLWQLYVSGYCWTAIATEIFAQSLIGVARALPSPPHSLPVDKNRIQPRVARW